MTAKFRIEGGGEGVVAAVVEHERHRPGLITYTHPLDHYDYQVRTLSSVEYGLDMAINPAPVAPTKQLIHNGTDNVGWTASNVVGGSFVFNSTAQAFDGTRSIDATATANNDTAGFLAPAPVNPTNIVALTFAIYITSFPTSGTKDITMQLFNGGAAVGVELSIQPYVGTQTFNTWLLVNIPLSDFGLAGVTQFDELRVKTIDSGRGTPPAYYLDLIELVEVSTSTGVINYRFQPDYGQNFSLLNFRVRAYNSTAAAADPTKFFGLTALAGGFELILRNKRRVFLTLIARNLWDFLRAPNCELEVIPDGTSGATFVMDFKIPLEHMLINGSEGAFVEVRVKDDLSSLNLLETSLHVAKLPEEGED